MKTINRIFESAKNIDTPEFPFSDEELRSVLRKETEAGESRPKENIFKKLGAFKMSMISLAIVGASLGVAFFSQPNDNVYLAKNEISKTPIESRAAHNDKAALALLDDGSQKSEKKTAKNDQHITTNVGKSGKADKSVTEADEYNYEAELFELTDEELAKLNVLRKGDAYLIELEDKIYQKLGMTERAELNDNGYPEKGIKRHVTALYPYGSPKSPRALRKYAGWDMDKSAGVFPITIMSESYNGDRLGISRTQGGIPAFSPDIEDVVSEQHFDGIGKKLLAARRKDASTRYVKVKVNDPDVVSKFFPVYIAMNKSDSEKAHILLWYPITSRTIAALPERYRTKAQGKLLLRDEDLSKNLCESEFLRNNPDMTLKDNERSDKPQPVTSQKKFAGIANLELTPEELKDIGIALDGNGLSFTVRDKVDLSELPTRAKDYFAGLGYDTGKNLLQVRGAFKMNFAEVRNGNIDGLMTQGGVDKYTGWNDDDWTLMQPVGIDYQANVMKANVNGKDTADRYIYNSTNSELFYNPKIINITGAQNPVDITDDYKLMPKVSRILPITVVYKFDENNNSGTIKVNLWFYMTPELAEKLPMRYGIPILEELELAEAIENGKNPESACGELNNQTSYLGICNLQNGGIKIKTIYPNPVAEGKLNLGFELKNASKITISLADYTGNVKEVLADKKAFSAGANAISLPIMTKESGVYLLIISDESGATAMERVLIK